MPLSLISMLFLGRGMLGLTKAAIKELCTSLLELKRNSGTVQLLFDSWRPLDMSDAPILDFFSEDFTLFIEAGFVAIKQSDEIAARRLFKTAEVLKPESVTPQIGLGYIALNKLLITESVSIFEGVLAKEPANHLARALLGVSYLLTKDKKKQGELLVQEAKRLSDDPTIHNLAETCMQWMEKDLLKSNFSPLNSPLGKADNQ